MLSLGDLANDVARAMYEWRVPLALVSGTAAIVFAALAVRLGWLAAARRHPTRSVGIVVAASLVVAPIGWYLGSPLVIRTSLVEPAPVASPTAPSIGSPPTPLATLAPSATVVRPATGAPSAATTVGPPSTPAAAPVPSGLPASTARFPTTVAAGTFAGTDDFHFGRGTATLLALEDGGHHLRLEDFSVRNGPDLFVYLSPDPEGYADGALELGRLKATDGSFGYDLPAAADPTDYRSALIWCKQFSHLFAVATLEAA